MSDPRNLDPSSGVHTDMEAAVALDRDTQLMLRVREGDDTSFALLLERHRGPVVNYLYRMVQNPAVSEELAQEVFLRVYRNRKGYEPAARFTTWLYRITTNIAFNWLRDHKREKGHESLDQERPDADGDARERQVSDEAPTVEQAMVKQARLGEVRRAIEALPEKQRAAVLMHKYEELEYSRIAGALSCSESAVKSLIFRAYETLRVRLAHMA